MSDSVLRTLLKSALAAREDEIGCEECYDLLDQYVDLIAEGGNPDELMPRVKQHLDYCSCCDGEFKALMTIINNAAAENKASSMP